MPSFSHESFSSEPDENGFRQRLSIDALRPIRKRTADSDIYYGMAFSSGTFLDDKHRKKMLVKFLKNSQNNNESRDFASHTVNLRQNLENMAREFNNSMMHMMAVKKDLPGTKRSNRIHFQALQMAQLESVSFVDKKRRKGEYFVFGEELPGCKVFLDTQWGFCERKEEGKKRRRSKSVNYGEETPLPKKRYRTFSLRDNDDDVTESTNYENDHEQVCLHAFVHFYFCRKNGEMAVDFLRGNYSNQDGYRLITPTVHSLFSGFGPNDCGEEGIRRVIDCHRCNELCRHLPAMKDILNNAFRDERTREEDAAYENTSPLVDDQRYQQRAVSMTTWPSQDHQFGQNGSMCPNLPRYEEYWQEDATLYRQCKAPSWQDRTTYERREGTLQEINRFFT